MTNGRALSENYAFKRMIHGIHGNSRRAASVHARQQRDRRVQQGGHPDAGRPDRRQQFVDGVGAGRDAAAAVVHRHRGPRRDGAGRLGQSRSTNYAAEVDYPQVGLNCNGCHVNNSWQNDPNPVGSVVAKPIDQATLKADTDPLAWLVITPKAASCTACHDSTNAINHVVGTGGSAFGNATQAQSFQTQESCADCHAPGLPRGVDVVHGQK